VGDIVLKPRDRVIGLPEPDTQSSGARAEILKPLIEDLRGRATIDSPSRVVTVAGVVRAPGEYPLETGMTVRDLLRAGGQPADAAYPQSAELTRYAVINGERRQTDVVAVDLAAVLRGDLSADVELRPFDVLTIKQVPEWTASEFVTLTGEFRFPGRYPIRRGETLRSVIERAGGISSQAFIEGAVFTRAFLREREKQQLEQLATRLQSDLAFLALRNMQSPEKSADGEQALAVGRTLLADLRAAEPVGRLVVNLSEILNGTAPDVELRDGDALAVPRPLQSVTVLGEVQSPTSHLWRSGASRDEYINLSGGLAPKADKKRIYVVRADGSVVAHGSGFFSRNSSAIRPGDTVVVPLNAESVRPLTLWTSVTQIIFNLAVAVAAVNSF
jgi:protein involved in polysaccharide export with SLBB domain